MRRGIALVVVVLLLTSLVAFAAFVAVTFSGLGDFTWRMLSMTADYRRISPSTAGYGYLRLLAGLSSLVAYLAYVQSRLNPSARERRFYRRAMYLSVPVSLMMAFYTQSRAALIFVFLNIIFIKYYLEERRLPWKILTTVAPVVIALFVITSGLRSGAGVAPHRTHRANQDRGANRAQYLNGGIDEKTGHIVNYFDATQEFKLGQSLGSLSGSGAARNGDKPANLDTEVGEKIYGAQTYGSSAVPPGFFERCT